MTFAFILESVGGTEWLVLLGVVLIVVGPKNLPAAARKLGSIMSTLRRAADEFKRQLLSMDEEFRKAVDDGENESQAAAASPTSTENASSATSSDGETADPAAAEDDPSKVPDSPDEPDLDVPEYDYNSPYPGHEFYDETRYEPASSEPAAEQPAEAPAPAAEPAKPAEPEKPKVDPYAIKITVSTTADKGKKKK